MPLIHSKTPKAFKKNIEMEMAHGKSQKQAVAIAYKMAGEHKASGGCVGPHCMGCSSANCMSEGGEVDNFKPRETLNKSHPEKHQQGIHESSRFGSKGVSMAGEDERAGLDSKEDHKRVLGELKAMPKPKLYAEGGSVDSWTKREDNEKGIHKDFYPRGGISRAGMHVRASQEEGNSHKQDDQSAAKRSHKRILSEMKGMPKPNLMAKGGRVEDDEIRGSLDKNYYVKGVHKPFVGNDRSQLGEATRGNWSFGSPENNKKKALSEHNKISSEMQKIPKPNLMAEGGAVEDGELEMDSELHHAIGGELMDALERKDKKGIMSALEAAVMSCMNKE